MRGFESENFGNTYHFAKIMKDARCFVLNWKLKNILKDFVHLIDASRYTFSEPMLRMQPNDL